jgi:acetolactate synthase-1/2/3 large subunit
MAKADENISVSIQLPLRPGAAAAPPVAKRAVHGVIADYAVALVTALGSDTVFTLTGGMAMHLNRAVGTQAGLRAIYCQHEQAAVAAAEGYASASDFRRAGFAVVTSGPGIANTVTSLLSANINSIPLIVLAGQIKSEDIDRIGLRTHGVQEVPSQAFITPCVKRFARLSREHFRDELTSALAEAFAGRPGPVVIEIPLDVQGAPIALDAGALDEDVARVRGLALASVEADTAAAAFGDIFAGLMTARRPLLYVGNGARIAGAEGWIRDFIEQAQVPAVFSWPAFDILPSGHPLNMGCPGGLAPIFANRVLGEADHIVFLGARLDLATTAFQRDAFGGQAIRTFVDVDAAELKKFAGYPRGAAARLDLRALVGAPIPAGMADPAWANWCQDQRTAGLAEEHRRLSGEQLNIYALSRRLSAWAQGRVVVPCSSGYATETFIRFFTPPEGSRSFTSAGLGAMGFGLPMALGAAFGSDRPVACVDADGGLMLNIQELATLRRLSPPGFVLFIMNNDGYESIRVSQERHFGAAYGSDEASGVTIPSFEALSAAFGLPYRRIDTLAQLDGFLADYDPAAPPIVVDVMIGRSEPRGPSVKTIVHADGRLASTPLAEIDW